MTIEEAIRTFRAVRQFAEQPLPEEAIRAILNAGRRSQSSKNTQPWQFVAVRERETLRQLSTCGRFAGHLAGAALGVALLATSEVPYDLGQVTAYMQLQAWELGIGSCIASIYEPDQARAILGVPDAMYFRYAISFGYPAPTLEAHAPLRAGGRQALEEVVHWERYPAGGAGGG